MRTLLTLFFGVALACQASQIFTVTFSPSVVPAETGTTVSVSGTLQNNDLSNEQFINGDNFNLPGGVSLDDSPFLANAPLSLVPGATSSLFVFFDVFVPAVQSQGFYDGSFTVFGGPDGGAGTAQDVLGTGTFTIQVVPEPSTMLLLGGALIAFIARRRR